MRVGKGLDFAKLLGFETLSNRFSKGIDFQDETVGAKLGAKAGGVEPDGPDRAQVSETFDFRDELINAKLGAKVGLEPPGDAPAKSR